MVVDAGLTEELLDAALRGDLGSCRGRSAIRRWQGIDRWSLRQGLAEQVVHSALPDLLETRLLHAGGYVLLR